MAIVKMKRLRLFGLNRDRDAMLAKLQELGCVEISQPGGGEEEEGLRPVTDTLLAQRKGELAQLQAALATLRRYEKPKGKLFSPRPTVPWKEFFDEETRAQALSVAESINEGEKTLISLEGEKTKLLAQKEALKPWLELDVPLDAPDTQDVALFFGALSLRGGLEELPSQLSAATELCQVVYGGKDTENQYVLVLCHKKGAEAAMEVLKRFGFSRANLRDYHGTARENDAALDRRLEALEAEKVHAEEAIKAHAGDFAALERCTDRLAQDIAREECKGSLLQTEETMLLKGWIPAEQEGELEKLAQEFTCAWETETPTPEEYPEVPVKLKNGWFSRPLNMVTEMYSLPAYGTVDPNPLMAPFFILFYGMMMADMGYGLIMILVSVWALKKLKPKGATMRYMTPLIGLCGVSTFIWGAVTGGFFGDLIPQMALLINPNSTLALPALFSPLDDAVPVLIGALVLGVIQIFVGMGVSMSQKIKRGETLAALCNEGAWYVVFLLGGLTALGVLPMNVGLIAILVLLVLTQGYGKKGIIGKIMGIFGSLYNNITGYFSDILSYSRLMALMLAGAVVAQVFNQLGAMTGNVIAFFIIAMIGNALNFALNILGCYVHDMRLQCLEFFGRFYEDGGKAFRPLEVNTQHVDLTNQ